jgi:hypothetical protein
VATSVPGRRLSTRAAGRGARLRVGDAHEVLLEPLRQHRGVVGRAGDVLGRVVGRVDDVLAGVDDDLPACHAVLRIVGGGRLLLVDGGRLRFVDELDVPRRAAGLHASAGRLLFTVLRVHDAVLAQTFEQSASMVPRSSSCPD